ncbi:MAG: PaaI family thioesterase [Dehalococcoidia bacterium]
MSEGDAPDFAALKREWEARPFLAALSIEVAKLEQGYARLTMPRNNVTVGGIRNSINGGVIAAYGELAAKVALSTTLGPGESIEGVVDIGLSFLTSALGDPTIAEGRVLRKGGRLCVCDVDISDGERGGLNAKARVSYTIKRPPRER